MTESILALLPAWAVFSAGMGIAWGIERRTGNSGWIDVAWTASLLAAALVGTGLATVFDPTTDPGRAAVALGLLAVWAMRLAGHLWSRSARVADDPRYAQLRADWGDAAPRRLAELLQWQAALSLPMVLCVIVAARVPGPPSVAGLAPGLAVACAGLWIGWKADRDLTAFKRGHAGLCTTGLWRLCRHPNYLGEIVFWAGMALLSVGHGAAGLVALAGPVTIWVLLRHVSGVPPLEAHMAQKYGPAFAEYRQTTPALFPWPGYRAGSDNDTTAR